MVILSSADFDEIELEETIRKRCSEFGVVINIEICRMSDPYCYDFAIVYMSNSHEAGDVVEVLGGKKDGSAVLMKILHGGKLIPEPMTLH